MDPNLVFAAIATPLLGWLTVVGISATRRGPDRDIDRWLAGYGVVAVAGQATVIVPVFVLLTRPF